MTDTPTNDAPATVAPVTDTPKPKRTRKPSASKASKGVSAATLKAARASTSGATLARAFNMPGKRVRDIARRIGFYQSDASRTLKKYQEGGAPAFGKARADIIAAVVKATTK